MTRPQPDADTLAEALRVRGLTPVLCPLMTVKAFDTPVDLKGVSALAFTSANGVRAYAAVDEHRDFPVYAVGAATAAAARSEGFGRVFAAAGDVETLAALLTAAYQEGSIDGAVLHIAGASRAGDLVGFLNKAGHPARRVVQYEAIAATNLPHAVAQQIEAAAPDWVTLFSPRTARLFTSLIDNAGLTHSCSRMKAAALSEAVADALEAKNWRAVHVAATPVADALIDVIETA